MPVFQILRIITMPTYTGISSDVFRHPLDWEAEKALRNLPGFDLVARKFVEFLAERPQFVYHMGNSIHVGPRQYSNIYHIFRECVRDLDISPEPSLFVAKRPISDAYTLGQDQPSIILSSGLFDIMSENEIRAVLSTQLGHIKCGHNTLNQMAIWVVSAASLVGQLTLGLGNLIITNGLLLAFYEWKRKSELSADRAALLVVDDLNTVMSSMMKLAGGNIKHGDQCSLSEFIRQSEDYQELDQDGLNQVYKFLLYNNPVEGIFLGNPFLVERAGYLRHWASSEQYRLIRDGNYEKYPSKGSVPIKAETVTIEIDEPSPIFEELLPEIIPIVGVPKVEITKIFYKGKVKRTQSDEYIEITNLGTAPADLSGWSITSSTGNKQSFTFPDGTVLQAGKSFRVYTNEIHPQWGGFSFGSASAIWRDTGDEGRLFDAEGNMVSGIAYDEDGNLTVIA
jgi:Zn-dependent protease with chaperone function